MNDDKQKLECELEAERGRVRELSDQCAKLTDQIAQLQSQLELYKPIAAHWMCEHGPTKEECERILGDMLDHPDELLDFEDVVRELEGQPDDSKEGDHAA
jgi:hypothetical protein